MHIDELSPVELQAYSAPEILCNAGAPTCGADIWSLGCVLLALYTSLPLLACKGKVDQMRHLISLLGWPDYAMEEITREEIKELRECKPEFASITVYLDSLRNNHSLSERLTDFLSRIFRLDAQSRENCEALLEHPLMKQEVHAPQVASLP